MKRLLGMLGLFLLLAPSAMAQALADQPDRPRGQQPPPVPPPGQQPPRPRAQAAIEDVVQGLFIAQFQEQVQVTDEQFVKILPYLRTGIRIMRGNAERSVRANNILRQALLRNAPEDEISMHIREFDEADRLNKANQQTFVRTLDPFLNTIQKGRFRVFQSTFDQRLRELVQRARQLNQAPRPEPPLQ